MKVATLISDFGVNDYYLSLIKGAILTKVQDVRLIDITNNVDPYDIVQAAFALRNTYRAFPEGSIHLVSVHNFYASNPEFIAAKCDGHYFIGPNNGVLSLALESGLDEAYQLELTERSTFPLQSLYADAVAHIHEDRPFDEIGSPFVNLQQKITFHPVTTADSIRGFIIYVDNYENVVTNVSRALFNQVGNGRPFKIYFKHSDPISKLCLHYYEVPIGEILALFNSADFLEIAINTGKAASMLGLKREDAIQIIFES